MIKKQTGSSLAIVMVYVAISSLYILGVAYQIKNIQKHTSNYQATVETTLFEKTLSTLLDNFDVCGNMLGSGFSTTTSSVNANVFDPNFTTPQPVIFREPSSGVQILFNSWPVDNALHLAPQEAHASQTLIIRSLAIQKRDPGGDLGGKILIEDPSGIEVEARGILADLIFNLESVRVEQKDAILGGGTFQRKIPMTVITERSTSGLDWRIAGCTSNQGGVDLPGWVTKKNCLFITSAGPNQPVQCPSGMFLIGANPVASTWGVTMTLECCSVQR